MINATKWFAVLTAMMFASEATFAASPRYVCGLTGKESKTCCCEKQKNGKLLCKNTGKTLDKCCCKTK